MSAPHCKYHPNEYASWFCPRCNIHSCVNCVTDPRGDLFPCCLLCRKTLTSLSISASQANLDIGNLLNSLMQLKNVLLMFVTGFLLSIVSVTTLGWMKMFAFSLVLIPFMGISFYLMEKISNNESAPIIIKKITQSLMLDVLLKFLVYLILLSIILKKSLMIGGPFGNLASAWFLFGMPASLVIIMMEKHFFSSLNPIKIFEIVRVFSGGYLILFICSCFSVLFLTAPFVLIAADSPFYMVKSFLFLFFSILLLQLIFGLMGKYVFRNHVELNYSVRSTQRSSLRTSKNDPMLEVDIYVQEGRFEDAIKILWKLIDDINSPQAFEKLIHLYQFQGQDPYRDKVCQQYFDLLDRMNDVKRATEFYLQLMDKNINFKPSKASFAVKIAREMQNPSHYSIAIQLLKKYAYQPGLDRHWETVSLCLAELIFEFEQDDSKALTLLNLILKRAVNQDVLERAEHYKNIIGSN